MNVMLKKSLARSLAIPFIFQSLAVFAEPEAREYPEVYPFVPFTVEEIYTNVKNVSEDQNYLYNIFDIHSKGYSQAKTKVQPWTSTYWPLNKGLIADPYDPKMNILKPGRELLWKHNYNRYLKRRNDVHTNIAALSQEDLDKLAPSEKYDLLLGDENFDLTNRLWDYAQKWGSDKENSFLTSLNVVGGNAPAKAQELVSAGLYSSVEEAMPRAVEMQGGLAERFASIFVEEGRFRNLVEALPEAVNLARQEASNYVLKKKNSQMATWEGICHGWATAAGVLPRPTKTVVVKLPSGKHLKFYPDDIKGLASMLWANSIVQDTKFVEDEDGGDEGGAEVTFGGGIISAGLRCNQKNPKRDRWGRYYDSKPDFYSKKLEPRCVGVHPAIWHLGLANIIGKQGRSFVVERKIKAAVDNHPMAAYKAEYFNPKSAKYGSLVNSIETLGDWDQFRNFRNENAVSAVGVKLTMTYLNWERPKRETTDHESKDSLKDIEMLYDLELDKDGNIVGGQWRITERSKPILGSITLLKNTQPNFFWVVTKDWKKFFPESNLTPWNDVKSLPPREWKEAARAAHAFEYKQTHEMGFNNKCRVVGSDSKIIEVPCEHTFNRPQPLVNVVNKLIDLSRK